MACLLPSILLLGFVAVLFDRLVPTWLVDSPTFTKTPNLRLSPMQRQVSVAMTGGKNAKEGIFSPLVQGAKATLGNATLAQLRGEVIKAHSKVISQLIDTSESPSGQFALEKLFEAADADGSGKLDKEEVRRALGALGFHWMTADKKVADFMRKADLNGDEELDFEEFSKVMPKTLRQNLVKLAKENGNSLGFLV